MKRFVAFTGIGILAAIPSYAVAWILGHVLGMIPEIAWWGAGGTYVLACMSANERIK